MTKSSISGVRTWSKDTYLFKHDESPPWSPNCSSDLTVPLPPLFLPWFKLLPSLHRMPSTVLQPTCLLPSVTPVSSHNGHQHNLYTVLASLCWTCQWLIPAFRENSDAMFKSLSPTWAVPYLSGLGISSLGSTHSHGVCSSFIFSTSLCLHLWLSLRFFSLTTFCCAFQSFPPSGILSPSSLLPELLPLENLSLKLPCSEKPYIIT